MTLQLLQDRLAQVQYYLSDFRERLAASENSYQVSLRLLSDPVLSSALMEQHVILSDRQRSSIARMEIIEARLQEQLMRLSKL